MPPLARRTLPCSSMERSVSEKCRSCSGTGTSPPRKLRQAPARHLGQRQPFAGDLGASVHSLFFSYSHKDEALRDQLEVQLSMLKRQGMISVWHDRRLLAGDDVDQGISAELESADIILLLASPDFLASEYCYSK